jgi:copper(I)-binding protein
MHRRTFLAAAGGLFVLPSLALARDYTLGALHIAGPWTRSAAAGQNAAGYLTIHNAGTHGDALTAVHCSLAAHVTLHASSMQAGVASMQTLAQIPIGPGATVALAPGGLHIMFEGLRAALAPGAMIAVTLTFQHAGTVPIRFAVQAPPRRAAPPMAGMPGMSH